MKTIKIILSLYMLFLLLACENDKILTPIADINISKTEFTINESMIIEFNGIADQVVIYTGDEMHDYELREQSNTGFVVNKEIFSYAYPVPGTYKVVCVASSYTERAKDLMRDTCSFVVNVKDDQTEIENISCPQILYDEVYAEKHQNDEWLMVLPRKVKYNQATPSISLSQRLRFYIQSDSTEIMINETKYSNTQKYDLSKSMNISVKSHFGTVRPYKLYTMYYPEFELFKLEGVSGKLIRSEYDYSSLEIQVTLPLDTDVSHLIPEFTTYSATDKVYVGVEEQSSGVSTIDFTTPVTYRIVSIFPERPDLQATTTIRITVDYKQL